MRTLSSINATTELEYEILVRLDDDDAENLAAIDEIKGTHRTFVTVGPRYGWQHLSRYYNELASAAKGRWVWIAGDDMIVHGPWDTELANLSGDWIVQPEISRIGPSTYRRAVRQAFPIVPMRSWFQFGEREIPESADISLHDRLTRVGWSTAFLPGVTIWHDHPRTGSHR